MLDNNEFMDLEISISCLIIKSPFILPSPLTSNLVCGVKVPIPTLPFEYDKSLFVLVHWEYKLVVPSSILSVVLVLNCVSNLVFV